MIIRLFVVMAAALALVACARDEPQERAEPPATPAERAAEPGTATSATAPDDTAAADRDGTVPVPADTAEASGTAEAAEGVVEPARSEQDSPAGGEPEPSAADEATAEEPPRRAVSPDGLHVLRAYVCKGIEQSEPTQAGKSFLPESDGLLRLCCFSEVAGAARPDTVLHVWYWGDREMARVALPVKSARWRTWSTKKILDEWRGEWRVDVTDRGGFVLASLDFSIE
jgi:hypothetical protein